MKTKPITIIDAIRDAKLFRSWFRDRKSWSAWEVFLKAMFGLPLKADELELYTQCTRRDEPPTTPAKEVWAIVGTSETSAQQANALIACATQREARFGGSLTLLRAEAFGCRLMHKNIFVAAITNSRQKIGNARSVDARGLLSF